MVPGDPFLYQNNFPYSLSAPIPTGNDVELHWTYPTPANTPSAVSAQPFPTGQTHRLFLQRSATENNTPLAPLNIGDLQTGPGNTPIIGNPPVDGNWVTIKSWTTPSDFPVSSYTDSHSTPGYYTYRLMLFSNSAAEGFTVLTELDWNFVTVVTPFTLNAVYDAVNKKTTLSWGAPKFGAIITGFTFVVAAGACARGCYRLDWVYAPETPSIYNVFTSYDGVNFSFATTIPVNGATPWYDSDNSINPDPAHNKWYYFQAQYPDGRRINSNTLHASY